MKKLQINDFITGAKEFAYDGCHKFYLIESEACKKGFYENGWNDNNFRPISELPKTFADCSCSLKFIQRGEKYNFQSIVPQFQKRTTFKWLYINYSTLSRADKIKNCRCPECGCELVSRQDGFKFCIRCTWPEHEELSLK